MSTPPSASTALLDGLVDDAGLFPPERLGMVPALRRHAADLASGHPMLSQRFVCPASRVAEALLVLGPDDPLDVALVADTGVSGVASAVRSAESDPRVSVVAVEARLTPGRLAADLGAMQATVPPAAVLWVETGWGDGLPERLDLLVAAGAGAKLRTGGAEQDLFPMSGALAAAISACVERGLTVKATAGLHRAVRYTDAATGLHHHGYLNLLLATARATSRADVAEVAAALDSSATEALVAEALALDVDQIRHMRAAFVSYGSCSTSEPREEAAHLGLVPPLTAATGAQAPMPAGSGSRLWPATLCRERRRAGR